jgi:response regulator RpfG family c-di-GMP phosphodiesterase
MTDTSDRRPRVLCVDDDGFMLSVLTRMIGVDYEVLTSSSGAEALQLIEDSEPIQVVVSDHRMPGLSGAQFLQAVRDTNPLIVRILLTGETDLIEAVAAMNQAGLFRFLLKPGTRPVLLDTLRAAVVQYQLQVAERELLQQTLIGTMRALSDVLAIANPTAFGHVSRIQELALAIARQMKLPEQWPLEFASLAAQLGHIALPEQTLRRLYAGESLSPAEGVQVAQSALVAERMLKRIPRLGPVVDILASLAAGRISDDSRASESTGAEILRVVSAYEAVERTTGSRDTAVHRVRAQAGQFDPEALKALTELLGFEGTGDETIEVPIGRVCVDMIVAEDLRTRTGVLLVPKGYRVSESFVARLGNFNTDLLPTAIRMRKAPGASCGNSRSTIEPGRVRHNQ